MIRLEDLSKSYDGGQTFAVHKVNLHVPEGKLLALLGGAGCGKTTTLKMINKLIEPTSGHIRVEGKDVTTSEPVALRRKIGYVIQGSGLFPHMTVAENIAVVPRLLGWEKKVIEARVHELLAQVRLPADFATRWPDQLSGGQQQRVGFARALATRPKVMLLDEPFGALDPITRTEVRQEFLRIQREENLTAVMVTHDMAEALLSADLIAVMWQGVLLQCGPPHELLTRPNCDRVRDMVTTPEREAKELADMLHTLTADYKNGASR